MHIIERCASLSRVPWQHGQQILAGTRLSVPQLSGEQAGMTVIRSGGADLQVQRQHQGHKIKQSDIMLLSFRSHTFLATLKQSVQIRHQWVSELVDSGLNAVV